MFKKNLSMKFSDIHVRVIMLQVFTLSGDAFVISSNVLLVFMAFHPDKYTNYKITYFHS